MRGKGEERVQGNAKVWNIGDWVNGRVTHRNSERRRTWNLGKSDTFDFGHVCLNYLWDIQVDVSHGNLEGWTLVFGD